MRYPIKFYDNDTTHVIEVVQGDSARVLEFEAVDYTIPEGAEATYYVKRPSNVPVYNEAEIDGDIVTVELTADALAEAGDNLLQVRIEKDGLFLTSFSVVLLVRRFGGLSAIEGAGQINLFDELIAELREQLANVIDPTLSVQNVAADARAVGDALATKQDVLPFDSTPTAGSNNPVTSDGVKQYVDENASDLHLSISGTKLIFGGN